MTKQKDNPETIAALKRRIKELEEDLADQIRFKEKLRAEVEALKASGQRNRAVLNAQIESLGSQLALRCAEVALVQAAYNELKEKNT